MKQGPRVLILAGPDESYKQMYHEIIDHCEVVGIIQEVENRSRRIFWRRLQKIGVIRSLGQVLFRLIVPSVLKISSGARLAHFRPQRSIDIQDNLIIRVGSVNHKEIPHMVKDLSPDICLLSGTRILSRSTIEHLGLPIWNIHTGLTPKYRGVHGGYWALYEGSPDEFGVTLHNVDTGIDTGNIIAQEVVALDAKDNFVTYPFVQLEAGYRLLVESILRFPEVQSHKGKGESRLWSHPTLMQYLVGRMRGVK